MTRRWSIVPMALLAACGARHPARSHGNTPGDRLEAAATAAGLVADPARADPIGLYGRDVERLCVTPGDRVGYRVGALVRFDDGQGCVARGVASRAGDRLDVTFAGDGDCRFAARFEGDRIVFPADLPAGCDRRCTGRASLAAMMVDRLSDGVAEAAAQGDERGRPLCS